MTLNDKYVQQIATLSIHERQNVEDHAHTVLAISRQFAAVGLDIPAVASATTDTPSQGPSQRKDRVEEWPCDILLTFVNNWKRSTRRESLSIHAGD